MIAHYIIVNPFLTPLYWSGSGWFKDKQKAKHYNTREDAEAVTDRLGLVANIIEERSNP